MFSFSTVGLERGTMKLIGFEERGEKAISELELTPQLFGDDTC